MQLLTPSLVFIMNFVALTDISINIHHELLEKCRTDDRVAQYEIYKLYNKAMFNAAFRILNDKEEAEDALQESFLSAFGNLKNYRGDASFGAWLKRIVVNKSITLLNKRKGMEEITSEVESDFFYEWDQESITFDLEISKVLEGIQKLPNGFRTVLTLYLFEGFDHKEIGQVLNITESTSKSQYNRAKKKLRELLETEVKYG